MASISFFWDFNPSINLSFSFSNSSSVNNGLITASEKRSSTLSLFFVRVNAKPDPKPTLIPAPRKSTSSLKSSFGIFVVPFPSIEPSSDITPVFSPSTIGFLSNLRE